MKKFNKKEKIAPQMAPDSDESYHDNYGVTQHMDEGGEVYAGPGSNAITAAGQQKIKHTVEALKQMANQTPVNSRYTQQKTTLPDDPSQFMAPAYKSQGNDATLANQANYEKQFNQKDATNAAAEQDYQNKQNALEEPQDESGYKNYADGGEVKKKRFSKIRKSMNGTKPEVDASKNPMNFIEDNKNMSIKGRKGVAF